MKVCEECYRPIDYRHDDACLVRHAAADYDLTQPLAPVGDLGQSTEDFERKRIQGLPNTGVTTDLRAMAAAVVTELTLPLRQSIDDLQADVRAVTGLMRTMDVPMEAIKDSHERASASFETLRRDILDGGVSKLERVLDTSGLTEQATKAEQRMESLVLRLEAKIDEKFKVVTSDMVQVLHLLERLHSRQIKDAQRKAARVKA